MNSITGSLAEEALVGRGLRSLGGPGRHLDDDPATDLNYAGNLRPAAIKAVTSLAQDTISAVSGIPDISAQPGALELFANPFSGLEEILYIKKSPVDGATSLLWLNKASSNDELGADGWSSHVLPVISPGSVVVTVHPSGTVYAWASTITAEGGARSPMLLKLQQDPDRPGGQWVSAGFDLDVPNGFTVSDFFVQYLPDNPVSPVVLGINRSITSPSVAIIAPTIPGQSKSGATWQLRWSFAMDGHDLAHLGAVGVDDAHMLSARAYALREDGTLWRTTADAPWISETPVRVQVDSGWSGIAGVWSTHNGVGCVGLGDKGSTLRTTQPSPSTRPAGFHNTSMPLDQSLSSGQARCDDQGLLHVYGVTENSRSVSVVHQQGWAWDANHQVAAPTWDAHSNTDSNAPSLGTVRSLFAAPATYVVDAYPDATANVLVLREGSGPEAVTLYAQQPGSGSWESEGVRQVPRLPENRVSTSLVSRYQTRVTVVNGYQSPVPLCMVILTADAPLDLEVDGTWYRTGPSTPVTLTADLTGAVTLRVLADGLVVPNMHLSVAGVAQSLTVQPAAEVHNFFAGVGKLPHLADGLNAETLLAAKTPAGDRLFSKISETAVDGIVSATADQALTWFAGAFAVGAGKTLPPAMADKYGGGKPVLGFSLQTHDPSRPACEVFTEVEELAAQREARITQGMVPGAPLEWFGDVVEGIRSGVTSAMAVAVDLQNRTLAVLVDVAEGSGTWLEARWADIVSAAHAVEVMCSAFGAAMSDVLAWVTWTFDLTDVWYTKQVLEKTYQQLPDQVALAMNWLRGNTEGWTVNAETRIREAFEGIHAALGATNFQDLDKPPAPTDGHGFPPEYEGFRGYFECAPVRWFSDLLWRATAGAPEPPPAGGDTFTDAMSNIRGLDGWELIQPALDKIMTAYGNLFDPNNPNNAWNIILDLVVGLFEELVVAGIKVAGAALELLITMVETLAKLALDFYRTPIDLPFLQGIYEFVQDQAGVGHDGYETLTIGRAGMLMMAFPATAIYKVVFGEAPFAQDASTVFDLPTSRSGDTQLGGLIPPPSWGALKVWQGFCSIMMAFDAWFDVEIQGQFFVDNFIHQDPERGSFGIPLQTWASAHFVAYAIGDYPPTWGYEFPPPSAKDPYEWGPTATWAMSFIANAGDLGCAFKFKKFINVFESNAGNRGIAAQIYMGLGIARTVLSGVRWQYDPNRGWPYSMWNCAINVTSFFSASTGFVRLAAATHPLSALWGGSFWVKTVLDGVCDLFAGIASTVQIVYEDNWPLGIVPLSPSGATVGTAYALSLEGVNGMRPWSWTTTPVKNPSAGATAGLPPGLALVDGNIGSISGTPTTAGTFEFLVTVTDSYGPSFQYQTDQPVQIVVSSKPGTPTSS